MTSPRLIAAVLAATTLTALPAFADSFDAEFNAQQERIARGVRSGQLNRSEVATLRAEQDRIQYMIHNARRDGRVNPYERREIERAQAAASQHIYAEKHDADVSPRRYGWWHRGEGFRRWW
jgi:uncharacterized membrane protein YebE (DUF533 family)